MARTWERGKLGVTVELSNSAVNLQPSIAALPSGEVYVAWETAANGRFQIQGRAFRDGRWQPAEIVSQGDDQEFRPVLAADSSGALWMAWDRAAGSRYQVVAKSRDGSGWSQEIDAVPRPERARAARSMPMPRAAPGFSPRASSPVSIARGQRYAALGSAGEVGRRRRSSSPSIRRTASGCSVSVGRRASFDWMAAWRNAALQMAVVDSDGLHELEQNEAALGLRRAAGGCRAGTSG